MAGQVNYDANNNDKNNNSNKDDLATSGGAMERVGGHQGGCDAARPERAHELGGEKTGGRRDEWHLLDVDGHSVVASSASSSSSNEQELAAGGAESRRRRRPTNPKAQGGRFVERSAGAGQSLSPALLYLCPALYSLVPLASFGALITLIWLLFTRFWFIPVAYVAYLLLNARTCNRGGCRVEAVYRSKFWTYLAAYFPIKLRYSSRFELDPKENYILNYHPHGIAAFGCVSSFATNGMNLASLFPGIRARFMVHETCFLVPVMRETFAARGDCSVNSKSFDYILSKKWSQKGEQGAGATGNLLALCGGGLAEADLSDAQSLKIVAATRKGIVKKALIHGAHLIPCIAFGENSVFTKVDFRPDSVLYKMEQKFYSLFGFKHPIYYGASLLAGDKFHGLLPYKRPITVVMADPIRVERVEQPSQAQIDQLHAKYIQTLRELYASNKHLCTKYDLQLEIL